MDVRATAGDNRSSLPAAIVHSRPASGSETTGISSSTVSMRSSSQAVPPEAVTSMRTKAVPTLPAR